MLIAGLAVTLAAGVLAWAVAALVRRHAATLGLVAEPNARSSHSAPTATGGGLGIVAGGTLAGLFAALQGRPETLFVVVLALLVAALGFIDDRRPIPARWRLMAQLLLVGIMVALFPAASLAATIGLGSLPPIVATAAIILAATYWLNTFNFMDGIDSLASVQAVFMLVAALWLSGGGAAETQHFWWFAGVAAATLGFLTLNWPPARLFMGDAGSTFLGFILAHQALVSIVNGWLSPFQWLILAALFLSDATLTLFRRALRREPVFSAHRLHAYQHLSRRWSSHRRVALLYLAVNLLLLLPLAWWAGLYPATAPLAAGLAYALLAGGLLWAGAGAPETS